MVAADVLVSLSRAEGLATVLIQAAAASLPFVSTDVDGPREMLARGSVGWIVPLEDVAAAAAATARGFASPRRAEVDLSDFEPNAVRLQYRTWFERAMRRSSIR
jgi:glycosyltransferase involved in cell wall biosynthesis